MTGPSTGFICPWCLKPLARDRCDHCATPAVGAEHVDLEEARPFSRRVLDERYRILRFIGQGGMGSVYKGFDRFVERLVAVKFLWTPDLDTENEVLAERFIREAKAIAKLDHDSIVKFHDFGQFERVRFIVMELLNGESLSRLLKTRGRLAVAETLDLAIPVARALATAHEAGVVHRDLKPDNIVLHRAPGRDRVVKVVDFGIAKMLSEESSERGLTNTGALIGTPAFMAPEQAMAEPVSPATDLYAFGVILYRMLAGVLPFEGQPVYLLHQHVHQPPPALPADVEVPSDLRELVFCLMQKAPAARPKSTQVVLETLEAIRCQVSGPRPDRSDPSAHRTSQPTVPRSDPRESPGSRVASRPSTPRPTPAVAPTAAPQQPDRPEEHAGTLRDPTPDQRSYAKPPRPRTEPDGPARRALTTWIVGGGALVGLLAALAWLLLGPGLATSVADTLAHCGRTPDGVRMTALVATSIDIPMTDTCTYKLSDSTGTVWVIADGPAPPEGLTVDIRGVPVSVNALASSCAEDGADEDFCSLAARAVQFVSGSCIVIEIERLDADWEE